MRIPYALSTVGRSPLRRPFSLLAGASAAVLAVSACSGGVGTAGGGSGGDGFEYGAQQADVDAVLEDLDPITLKFQPSAASENSTLAPAGTVFRDLVEERSNGKITIEMVWGQAIADYDSVHDALAVVPWEVVNTA